MSGKAFDGLGDIDEVAQDGNVGECEIQYCGRIEERGGGAVQPWKRGSLEQGISQSRVRAGELDLPFPGLLAVVPSPPSTTLGTYLTYAMLARLVPEGLVLIQATLSS